MKEVLNPRVCCVITSHNRPELLTQAWHGMMNQTYHIHEIIVLCSGYPADLPLPVKGIEVPDKNDWGHSKRAQGLQMCHSRASYIFFVNDDDIYTPDFVEKMIRKAQETGADLIYCNFKSHLYGGSVVDAYPDHGRITSGNFIVNAKLAKKVGYNHRHYQADWEFIRDLIKSGAKTAKVDEVLYEHN